MLLLVEAPSLLLDFWKLLLGGQQTVLVLKVFLPLRTVDSLFPTCYIPDDEGRQHGLLPEARRLADILSYWNLDGEV